MARLRIVIKSDSVEREYLAGKISSWDVFSRTKDAARREVASGCFPSADRAKTSPHMSERDYARVKGTAAGASAPAVPRERITKSRAKK